MGRIVTLSFIQAYAKLVASLEGPGPAGEGTAPAKTFTVQNPVTMRRTGNAKGAVIRTLPVGTIVYPTGQRNGLRWEVVDESNNIGWVLNTRLAPSQ